MQKFLPLLIVCISISLGSRAQLNRYIIRLTDKGFNPYSISNPSAYLSQRAIDRRTRYNIAIDSTDLPVTPNYIDSIRLAGNVTIINISKWLNQVAIQTTDHVALNKISTFPFVNATIPIASKMPERPVNKQLDVPGLNPGNSNNIIQTTNDYYNYGQSFGQVKIHNGNFLHNHGFRGEGMQMAVLDAGFYHYLSLPTFDSIRNNNQVLGTWDFVANEASVDEDYYHGMQCLSTIAANLPGTFVGTAPKTSFYLFRTEDVSSEYPIEEQNWAAAVEKADSLGVDVTSTSLGYTQFDDASLNYAYADMNGNTTISARASDLASKKGMLVVAAAGNEGNNSWHYIATPSDADSNLCVAAVNTAGQVAGFSSYGPSSDGQTKPAVAAVGVNAIVANLTSGQPDYNSGTSFACPNMAGITTCLWQAFPEYNNMTIIDALEASGTKYNAPDNRVGFGIPDAKKAFVILVKKGYTGSTNITGCSATIAFDVKLDNTTSINIERKLPGETNYSTVTTLTHTGNFATEHFSFDDDLSAAPTGDINYRLKMDITTDTSFILGEFVVNYAEACYTPASNNIYIGPNPVYTNLNIRIERISAAKATVILMNSAGQKVYNSNNFDLIAGVQSKIIPMQNLSKGVYFVAVYIDNKKAITKKIIRR